MQLAWWETGQILFIWKWLWETDKGGREGREERKKTKEWEGQRSFLLYCQCYRSALQPDEGDCLAVWVSVWVVVQDGVTTRVGLEQEAGRHQNLKQMTGGHGAVPLHISFVTTVHVYCHCWMKMCLSLSGYVLSKAVMFNDFPRQFQLGPKGKSSTERRWWLNYGVIKVKWTPVHSDFSPPLSSTNRSSQVSTNCCQKSALCTAGHQGRQNSSPTGHV